MASEWLTHSSAFSVTAVKEGGMEEVSLEQYKGKWVLLVFYPMVSDSQDHHVQNERGCS